MFIGNIMIALKKFSKVLLKLQESVGIFLVLLIFLLTAAQVFSRFILNNPLGWTEELVRFVFIWSVFWGAVILSKERQHIRVEIFHKYFSNSVNTFIKIFINISIVIFFIYIIPPAFSYALYAYNIKSTALGISMFFVYISLPLCGVFMTIYYIGHIIEDIYKFTKYHKSKKN